MVRLRFLIIYPSWFGTEVIITVLLLLLFPGIGFCARSSSMHSMDETALAKEKTTKMVVHWKAINAWHGKVPGGSKGEKHYCTYIYPVGLQSPRLYGLLFSPRHTEWKA
ncbi:hypothetical protein QBC45DRAFT_449351 [Copromyces sp. CBS 386.78]|nr:hypothetical protein QBC45DRAFT_449351 [Copromyces sp. CBS 386.78]